MTTIDNVVVLGDSMSDIGIKWTTPTGRLARLTTLARVNKAGRFSDGRNWVDFLVEWATGASLVWLDPDMTLRISEQHKTVSAAAVLDVDPPATPKEKLPEKLDDYLKLLEKSRQEARKPLPTAPKLLFADLAVGGAVAARDWGIADLKVKLGLSPLKEQVDDYLQQRGRYPLRGQTMHIIWIGLNDFVTALRPDYDRSTLTAAPAGNDFGPWHTWAQAHAGELRNGVGVYPVVAEIRQLIESINATTGAAASNHFAVVDLPRVYNAVRYMEGLADEEKLAEAKRIQPVVDVYNAMLKSLVANWPAGPNAPAAGHVHLVEMSGWMDSVGAKPESWGLSKKAQEKGVPVFYGSVGGRDPIAADVRNRVTTSDLAHPTEAVYRIMAMNVVNTILDNGYSLGRLPSAEDRGDAPLPFQVPRV